VDLDAYINQEVPQRMPTVYLKENEYSLGIKTPVVTFAGRKDTGQQIWVNGFLYEYCLVGEVLYTTDGDGNPKNMSCFRLAKHVKTI